MKGGVKSLENWACGASASAHSFAVACWTNFEREAQRFINLGDLSPESFPAT
jgi:hypothetical protein